MARLTADNLVFLRRMKEAEAKLAACEKELTQLQQHKGPWFEEVRQLPVDRGRGFFCSGSGCVHSKHGSQ